MSDPIVRAAHDLVVTVADLAQRTLMNPDPGKKIEQEVEALDLLLDAGKKFIELTSTSSSPLYALKDSPPEVQASIKSAVHALRILRNTYGPQLARSDS